MSETFVIKPRRVPEASLPAHADEGELILTQDTGKMFVGKGPTTPLMQVGGGAMPSGAQNLVLATPNGASGVAVLRALVANDIPALTALYDVYGAAAAALAAAEAYALGLGSNYDAAGTAAAVVATEITNRNAAIAVETSRAEAAEALLASSASVTTAIGVETARAETAEGLLVPKTTTVNGHALSANVVVSASDLTTGTLPHAQLPTLLSGDVPNNAANTSGASASCTGNAATATTAGNLSGTPALPNGTTATTQGALDASARLGTTAYTDAAVGVEKTRALAAEALLVPQTTQVNGHALSGNITVAYADLSGNPAWNVEGNATGNLSINNAAFTSTFNQTAAAAWLWANTTVGASGSTNASPLLELAANYWTGAASAQDLWTIQSSLVAGTNGVSALNIAHSGSTGQAAVILPAGAANKPSLQFAGSTAATGFYASPSGTGYIACQGVLEIYNGTTSALSLAPNGSGNTGISMVVGLTNGNFSNGTVILAANAKGGNLITFGNINSNVISTGSGSSAGVALGLGSGTGNGNLVWQPTVGTGSFAACLINPLINNTAVLVTQAITSCTTSSATAATLTVTTGTAYAVGATIVVSGLSAANNLQLNGTWVVASTGATTVVITGSGWTTHTATGDTGTLTQTPGGYTGLKIAAVETSLGGSSVNKMIDCYAGVSGTTAVFSVDNVGKVVGKVFAATSAGTAGAPSISWGGTAGIFGGGGANQIGLVAGGNEQLRITNGGLTHILNFMFASVIGPTGDANISRLAAGSLAIGNGTASDTTGTLTLGKLIATATLSPTSAATAGVTGQIAWDTGKIYVCTSGGIAGAATWKAATLTAV